MALATAKDAKGSGSDKEPPVLVIDPNEEHQVLSTMALGRRGFRVTIAGTGREGLRVALSQSFAVIVLDLKLRDMAALDVLSVLRERIPDVPKILVVAAGQEQTAVQALAAGASGFLVKTARYNELLPSEVEAQIRAAQARRSLKEQKRALGESEERFRKAFRASPVAFTIVARSDGKFLEANDAFLRLVGYDRDELIGRTGFELVLPANAESEKRIDQALAEKGSVRELETFFRTKSGGIRNGLVSVESIEIEGEPCLLTILRDVTEEQRSERLREALFEISEATSTTRDLPELFHQIHRSVATLMPAENLYIALYDTTSDTVSFPYFVDEKEATPAPYKAGRGLTEFVLRSAAPLLVTPESFERLVVEGSVESVGATGVDWLGVPLSAGGRTFGVLAVQSYAESIRYTEAEKQILSMISAQVALAIDRKRSDEALRNAEARFRTMFVDSPVGIALADLQGNFLDTNPAFQRMLGYGGEELVGVNFSAVTFPDDVPLSQRESFSLADGQREHAQYAKRYLRKDGTHFWARVTIALLRTPEGAPRAMLGMIEDVTQEREALEAREMDRRRFEAILAKMRDAVSLMSLEGKVTWESPSVSRMFGYTPEESLGKSGLEFLHPDDLALLGQGFADLMTSPGKSVVAEARVRCKDGTWRWTEIIGTNLLEDPDLRALVLNYRDITERNDALEQIRFQASLLGQVRNAVVATDVDLRIVYWNDYATRMYGRKGSEVRGKSVADMLISPEAKSDFGVALKSLRESGHWEGERVMARRDGSRFPASVTVTALRGPTGAVAGYVAVVSDVTERVKASKALESRARQQAAIAALGQKALQEPSISGLLNDAIATLTKTLGVEYASILELTPDQTAFTIRARVAWDLPLGTRISNDPKESQAAYTLSTGGPIILENAATETRFKVPALFTERGLASGITVAIPGQASPFGVLSAHSKSPRAFSPDDVDFVAAVANVIASAIERGRMEKALAQNERLASMGQLAAYVAHEINTPLTNISLLTSSIARREKD
ncbi:MAG TPA: PAS domain S-box protein, partial [Thermoplasmata archaeon]|nr:PAS domain S-box protein [Thermoplasmata archaeon]